VNKRGDEITGDYEENVDPNKSASKWPNLKMVEHNGQHSDSAQPVYVRPVFYRRGSPET
jgi:hypothetical protein